VYPTKEIVLVHRASSSNKLSIRIIHTPRIYMAPFNGNSAGVSRKPTNGGGVKKRPTVKPPKCNKIFLSDINATHKAVLQVFDEADARKLHEIPEHDASKLRGRVQRAIKTLRNENSRTLAVRANRRLYEEPAGPMLRRYFKLLCTMSRPEERIRICREYEKLLFSTLDVALMEDVRKKLYCNTGDSGSQGSATAGSGPANSRTRPSSGSIAARMDTSMTAGRAVCEVCENETEFEFSMDRNEQKSCKICFTVIDQLSDTRRVYHPLSSTFPPCDRTAPFREMLKRYQGQRAVTISDGVVTTVRSMLVERGIPVESATRRDVMQCLMKKHMSAEYKDAFMVHSMVTGRPLDKLHHLEDALVVDYCTVLDAYNEYVGSDARGPEHLMFLLYLLLKNAGHPCSDHDFPSTVDFSTIDMCYDVYRVLFKRLGWEYKPF
jgi:Poxvirus Late Transcription Factor VLTF3 like